MRSARAQEEQGGHGPHVDLDGVPRSSSELFSFPSKRGLRTPKKLNAHDRRYLASPGAKHAQMRHTANASNGGHIQYDAEQANADHGMPSLAACASAPSIMRSPRQLRGQFSASNASRQFSEIEPQQRRISEEMERGPVYPSGWGTQSVPATPNRGGGAQHLQRASVSQHSTRFRPSTNGSTRRPSTQQSDRSSHNMTSFYEVPTKSWGENSFRMSVMQGNTPPIDRIPLPQELLDEMSDLEPRENLTRQSTRSTVHAGVDPNGYLTADGVYSDGHSWCREPEIDEMGPPMLSHSWWEDTIYPRLFPRNVPGGREWDLLRESLVGMLTPLSKDKSAAGAEQLLAKVFRMAFHEIYRRLPLFRGAVIHSEQEFSRLKDRLAAVRGEEAAKVEQLKSEGLQASCAAEVWRDRAARAEAHIAPMASEVAQTREEMRSFKAELGSAHDLLLEANEDLTRQLTEARQQMEHTKADQDRTLKKQVELAVHKATVQNNETLIRMKHDGNERVAELKKKIAQAQAECGEKILDNGKMANVERTLKKTIELYEKAFKDAGMEMPDPLRKSFKK